MGEKKEMASAIADKLVKGVLCGEVIWRSEKLEGASFYNYESKRALEHASCVTHKAEPSQLHISPNLEDTENMFTPVPPWRCSHQLWHPKKKSAFYYCLVLVSLVCNISVVSLKWTKKSFWIDLLLWGTELETSSKSGSLGYSQSPQITSGKSYSICLFHWRQT